MPEIQGALVERDEWPRFTWTADLVDFEGPLVSLYRTDSDDDALWVWVDRTLRTSRWCIVPIGRTALDLYLRKKFSLREVFDAADWVILANVSASGRRSKAQWVDLEDLPAEYLPDADSYLSEELATDAARSLVAEAAGPYRVQLSGNLYAEDLQVIPKVMGQLYSFHYGLTHMSSPAVRNKMNEGMQKWRGGIDAVNLFNSLRSVIPSVHRVRVKEMEYHSPGHIEFELLKSEVEDVKGAIDRIADRATFKHCEELQNLVYAYLRDQGLNGFERSDRARRVTLSRPQRKALAEFVSQFLEIMGWDAHADAFNALEVDELSKLRALMAYYRRLKQIRPLVIAHKVAFPSSRQRPRRS